jgi:putative ABC transport system permease protein
VVRRASLLAAFAPLNRKLLRDLWRLRGQALAIALIVASGVAVLCSSLAVVEALLETANAFYDRQNFAHVFASATRAPRHLLERIRGIDGVQAVEARVVRFATIDVAGFDEPVVGTLISLPEGGNATLNRLQLRQGLLPRAGQPGDVVISEGFAEAHALTPGALLHALINGRRRPLRVSGIALSPEFVYAIGPGALMPDAKRFGIMWMGEQALTAAYDLEGAFNDVTLTLSRGAREDEVIHHLDTLLAPFGGTGAVARADQISNWFVMNEIRQLRSMAGVLPAIFLAVAAFLSNMVLARLIATERAEIGLLKAFGYGNLAVGWHYSKLVLAIAGSGVLAGWACGWWLGLWTTALYAELFRFPLLYYRPGPQPFLLAGMVSLLAALLGAILAARRAAALPPAEAMRPPMPGSYRSAGALGRPARRWIEQLTRIVLRQLIRWPLRAALTSLGMAASVAVLIMAFQWLDALDLMVQSTFFDQQRQDVIVSLVDEHPTRVRYEFARLPGVQAVEVRRFVDARLRSHQRSRREAIVGIPAGGALEVLKDRDGHTVAIPPAGLVLSGALAKRLQVGPGDDILVEVMEGHRPVLHVPVAAVFNTWIGTPAYMHLDALNRALGEGPRVNALLLKVDPRQMSRLYTDLKATPSVAAVTSRRSVVDAFNDTIAENTMIFITIYVGFAGVMAVGVTYNSMRIALSERGRELATLRVLGFTGNEVAYVLLGEAALLVLIALPLGCLLGRMLTQWISASFETELFRIPPVVEPSTYGMAVIITVIMCALCGMLMHRRVDHLDLIRVLKTRE